VHNAQRDEYGTRNSTYGKNKGGNEQQQIKDENKKKKQFRKNEKSNLKEKKTKTLI